MSTIVCTVSENLGFDKTGLLYERNSFGKFKKFNGLQQFLQKIHPDRQTDLLDDLNMLQYTRENWADKIRVSSNVAKTFKEHRYYASGSKSCMANKDPLLEVYRQNKADVILVEFYDLPKQTWGSVVVWNGKRFWYVDRPYPDRMEYTFNSIDQTVKFTWDFMVWAIGKYLSDNLGISKPATNLRKIKEKISFRLNWDGDYCLPYMDSLVYARELSSEKIVVSNRDYGSHSWHTCDSTSGTNPGDGSEEANLGTPCHCCETPIFEDSDDYRTDDNGHVWCSDCYHDHYSYDEIGDCDVPAEDIEEFQIIGRNGRERSVYSTRDSISYDYRESVGSSGVWVHENQAIETYEGEYIAQTDVDSGEWVLASDTDGYHLAEDCTLVDGEWYFEELPETDDDDDDDDDDETQAVSEVSETVETIETQTNRDWESLRFIPAD